MCGSMPDFDWDDPEWTDLRVAKLRIDALAQGITIEEDAALLLHHTYHRTASAELAKLVVYFRAQGLVTIERASLVRLIN